MEDQKDKQCRIIFYSQFSSYLPGVPLILSTTVIYSNGKAEFSPLLQCYTWSFRNHSMVEYFMVFGAQ